MKELTDYRKSQLEEANNLCVSKHNCDGKVYPYITLRYNYTPVITEFDRAPTLKKCVDLAKQYANEYGLPLYCSSSYFDSQECEGLQML